MGSLHGAIRRDLGTRRLRLRCVGNSMLPCWAAQNMFLAVDPSGVGILGCADAVYYAKGGEASNAWLQASKLMELRRTFRWDDLSNPKIP